MSRVLIDPLLDSNDGGIAASLAIGSDAANAWFSKLKERCVRREEFETLDEAREEIDAYIHSYHHRPHSRLAYRAPRAVAATWKDHDNHDPSGLTDNAHWVQANSVPRLRRGPQTS